ncbi:MarR family winged helix-turn-helix transcriptional regulator [Noviherbaspirillum cavernae]|nr:MarR family winged helix-turn-helix transcriptional regulator [Noviherbaspirillum cavernae]
MEKRVMERAPVSGYGFVTPAMNRMFAHLRGRPVGLSEIARDLDISRQAVHQLANEAAQLGLVEFVPSEADGRVKLLRFTQKGWAMSDSAAQAFEEIENELADHIGKKDLQDLKRILGKSWSDTERSDNEH